MGESDRSSRGVSSVFSSASYRFKPLEPILISAVCLTWLLILPRIVPNRISDRGIFVSTAARLLAGDTLYSGVYDNKEPLFYYMIAGELSLGRWSEVAIEALLIACSAISVFLIGRRVASPWISSAIAFAACPILLTGYAYVPGYSELPGIAIAFVAIAASAYEKNALAGACLGVLAFTKLIYLPVALLGVSCFVADGRLLAKFGAIFICAILSAALIVVVLFVRGELLPFVHNIGLNFSYSQETATSSNNELVSLAEHLRRVGPRELAILIAPTVLAVIICMSADARSGSDAAFEKSLFVASLATLGGSIAVLALTGLWGHHRQILCVPETLILLRLSAVFDNIGFGRLKSIAVIGLAAIILADAGALEQYARAVLSVRESYAQLNELSPEARKVLAVGSSGTYARFGGNDDRGSAVGLGKWKLLCPRFHQYRFQAASVLDESLKCAANAQVLIISEGFGPAPDSPTWNAFVAGVGHLLQNYSCDAPTGLRVCTKL